MGREGAPADSPLHAWLCPKGVDAALLTRAHAAGVGLVIDGRWVVDADTDSAPLGPLDGLAGAAFEPPVLVVSRNDAVALAEGLTRGLVTLDVTDCGSVEISTRPIRSLIARVGRPDARRRIVMIARAYADSGSPGAHESAAGAAAMLETLRVFAAVRAAAGLAEPGFAVEARLLAGAPEAASEGLPSSLGVETLLVLEFGELGFGAHRDELDLSVSGPTPGVVRDLWPVVARLQGERGFWTNARWVTPRDLAGTSQALGLSPAPLVTLQCASGRGGDRRHAAGPDADSRPTIVLDASPWASTGGDTIEHGPGAEPQNAVSAARLALMLLLKACEEFPR